jgi:hypothetical protein
MSPEQVEAKELDGRSDIFSLGAVLYEMLTGQRAFPGKSQLSVASAILEKEPAPISSVKPLTPPALDHAIRRSLAKEVERRWQSAADLAGELQWIAEAGSQAGVPAPLVSHRKVRERLAWSVAALLAVALAPVAFLHLREIPPTPAAPARFQIPAPENATFGPYLKLSPDGRKLAFVAGGTCGCISGVGRIAGFNGRGQFTILVPGQPLHRVSIPRKLKKIEATGGLHRLYRTSSAVLGRGAWNQDGVIVFGALSGLFQVPAPRRCSRQLTTVDSHAMKDFISVPPSYRWRHFVHIRDSADRRKAGLSRLRGCQT